MDQRYSAQDLIRCKCENIPWRYCDDCEIILCENCKQSHTGHKIIPYDVNNSLLEYPQCDLHKKQTCKYQCENCNVIACNDCVAHDHAEHTLSELKAIYSTKKEHIQKDLEKLEKQVLPSIEKAYNELSGLDDKFLKMKMQLSEKEEEFFREVRILFDQLRMNISKEAEHVGTLKQDYKKNIHEAQSLVHVLKKMDNSFEVYPTVQYRSKINELLKLPLIVKVEVPEIISKQEVMDELHKAFQLTSLHIEYKEIDLAPEKSVDFVREFLNEPKIVNVLTTGNKHLCNVTCLNEDHVWTSDQTAEIKCYNTKGVLQKSTKTTSGNQPNDIAIDKDGAIVYSDGPSKTVNRVVNDQTKEIIRLPGFIPGNLCVTSSNDILVVITNDKTTQSKVLRLENSEIVLSIQFDDKGKPLFSEKCTTKYVKENKNLDICVADSDAGAVVVVNQAGELRFRYTGGHTSSKRNQFRPFGITTDSQSHILTVDDQSHCIHILDQDGKFLRFIDNCDLKAAYGICVDNSDNLFVCKFWKGDLKKIKYLK